MPSRRRPSTLSRPPAILALAAVLAVAAGTSFAAAGATVGAAAAGPSAVLPPAPSPVATAPDDPAIVHVVAAGHSVPAQRIRTVENVPATFVWTIAGGAARFAGDRAGDVAGDPHGDVAGGGSGARATMTVTVTSDGWLMQPAIRPGPPDDVSIVAVRRADGTPAAESRGVFTVSRHGLRQLQRVLEPDDAAVLDAGDHHIVVDLRAVQDVRSVTVFGLGPGAGSTTSAVDVASVGQNGWGDGQNGDGHGGNVAPDVRSAWTPGHVTFAMADPAAAGYWIKPGGANTLVAATAAGREADAVYRTTWGCCASFRIPNGCTVTVQGADGGYAAHCNLVAWLAGKRLAFVDPCARAGWPRCPPR